MQVRVVHRDRRVSVLKENQAQFRRVPISFVCVLGLLGEALRDPLA